MAVTRAQFALLADVVRRRSGLELPLNKLDLVKSKLAPVVARFGFRRTGELLAELADEPEELARAVTEAMTTNETSFFRDPRAFDLIRTEILPALTAARLTARRLRIWCAACSTGQEPYSLAILMDETGLFADGWKVDLFATDLSSEAIARTHAGPYSAYEVERGLPENYRVRYFTRDGEQWRVADHIRCRLRVHHFNLLDSYGWLGRLDLILCRNALLYFSHSDKLETLARLDKALAPDGWLVLGSTETAADRPDLFASGGALRGFYVKARSVAGRPARLAV